MNCFLHSYRQADAMMPKTMFFSWAIGWGFEIWGLFFKIKNVMAWCGIEEGDVFLLGET